MRFVAGLSIKEIVRRTGRDRNTVRRALRSERAPRYARRPVASKLDPFKDEIHRLLREDPKLPGQRIRELIEPLGYAGSKTILDDYLRELRPLFCPPPRTFQRTAYRPGEVCQFDLWEPSAPVEVGHLEQRRGWVVVACLGYSRAGAGALIFSKETPDLLWGIARCLWSLGGLPETLVWDRQAGIHGHGGRPTGEFAALCGLLKVGWRFCEPADPQAKGVVERLQGYLETNFERGRRLAEREVMATLPTFPDLDRRWVARVPVDPYLRFDTNDYSLDPALAGRRVEVRVSQTEVMAVCLDTGEPAARHVRSFARHRTITAIEHVRALRERRGERPEPVVETRPLAAYDRLIA